MLGLIIHDEHDPFAHVDLSRQKKLRIPDGSPIPGSMIRDQDMLSLCPGPSETFLIWVRTPLNVLVFLESHSRSWAY
jgi:hypothetical protein